MINNQLTSIPDQLMEMPALKKIYLDGNPISKISDIKQNSSGLKMLSVKRSGLSTPQKEALIRQLATVKVIL
jgi:Leucine-rich repeat (LRR) protein